MTKESTKGLLLERGAEIVLEKGFNHTGIQEILKAAKVPKGSFYFYFKNKEDFGLQLIDFYAQGLLMMMNDYFSDESTGPVNRLKRFFEDFVARFAENNYKGGCPIGNIAQEMADVNEQFSIKLDSTFKRMSDKIGLCLKEAQKADEISDTFDPFEMADFIIDSWEGALLRMKVTRSTDPLKLFYKMILEHLLEK